jgi:polyisoprenoid-binding protein YceI
VALRSGSHRLGPDNAKLSVRTGRAGAAAKAGHDLTMLVTAWEATIEAADDPAQTSMRLTADASSLRVQEGTGGMQELGDEDVENIHQTIDEEVLLRHDIEFRSTEVSDTPGGLHVEGELTIVGRTEPISFELEVGDEGELEAEAVVSQPAWGMKPYSTLFGALKVHEDVRVRLEGQSR